MVQNKSTPILTTIGWGLLILACICWLAAFITPFFPLSLTYKATIITSFLIIAEAFFWVGAILLGKELVAKYRSQLNPKNWRKSKQKNSEDSH